MDAKTPRVTGELPGGTVTKNSDKNIKQRACTHPLEDGGQYIFSGFGVCHRPYFR